jgi:hypothetical protein
MEIKTPEGETSMQRRMEAQLATEVYVSDMGNICIRQEDPMGEDAVVVLEPARVPQIIQWLEEALADAKELKEGNS